MKEVKISSLAEDFETLGGKVPEDLIPSIMEEKRLAEKGVYAKLKLGDTIVDDEGKPLLNKDTTAVLVLDNATMEKLKDGSIRFIGEFNGKQSQWIFSAKELKAIAGFLK
jgi:hypothetical protein